MPDARCVCASDTLRVRKRGRDGLRSACTVPHTVPTQHLRHWAGVSFREARVGRRPGSLPGPRTKSRWVYGSIPVGGCRELSGSRFSQACLE